MRTIFTIALKDIRTLLRDRANSFFVLVFPLAIAIFFGSIFGASDSRIPIAVVMESNGPIAQDFLNTLNNEEAFIVRRMNDRAAGDSSVRLGTVAACVIIPETFDTTLEKTFAGASAIVDVHCDPARKAESALIMGKLNELAMKSIVDMFRDTKIFAKMLTQSKLALAMNPTMPSEERGRVEDVLDAVQKLLKNQQPQELKSSNMFAVLPIQIHSEAIASDSPMPKSAFAITFPQGLAWGFMGCVSAFGASMAEERKRGTFLRLVIAPCSIAQVLAGKSLACFTAAIGMSCFLLLVAIFGFGVSVGNWPMLAMALSACAFAFSGFTMAITGLFNKTEGSARSAGNAIILILAMIGGGTIPLAFMPPFLRMASQGSPFSWAILCIEGAIWRGFTLLEMLPSLIILLCIGIAGILIGNAAIKKSLR